jgi:hypothetical protein
MVVEGLIGGLIAGAAYGIIGYVKAKDNDSEITFDWNDFGITVVGSAIIGGYSVYSGLGIDVVSASAIGVVVTQAVRKLWTISLAYLDKVITK